MDRSNTQTALVVYASRGLGLAIVRALISRGWSVVATERTAGDSDLRAASDLLKGRLQVEALDMTDDAFIHLLRGHLAGRRLNLLFVVAGMADGPDDLVDKVSTDRFVAVMVTNALGPLRVVSTLDDLVHPGGTIAVISSSLGSVALTETGTWEVYRASKAALNTLVRSYAARQLANRRTLALVDPGFVRTDMGGSGATLGVDESIPGVLDALRGEAGTPGLTYFNFKGAEAAMVIVTPSHAGRDDHPLSRPCRRPLRPRRHFGSSWMRERRFERGAMAVIAGKLFLVVAIAVTLTGPAWSQSQTDLSIAAQASSDAADAAMNRQWRETYAAMGQWDAGDASRSGPSLAMAALDSQRVWLRLQDQQCSI